jgi:hypothetical protein
MEMFGYFCSPLCKAKAEDQNLVAPVYAGRKDLVEAKFWRKTGLMFGGIAALVLLFFGGWTWYAWFGSVPHTYFAVRFADDDRAYSGKSQLVGDQLIFLHGGTLARYDLKRKRQVWSQELISKAQIDAVVKRQNEMEQEMNSGEGYHHWRSADAILKSSKQILQAQLELRVAGKNIWVGRGGKLTQYDWDTGKFQRDVPLPEFAGRLIEKGDELMFMGDQSVTHISLVSGESTVERFGGAGGPLLASAQGSNLSSDNGQPLDPAAVEARVQNLTLPGRIALPALLASAEHERQLEAELKGDSKRPRSKTSAASKAPLDNFQIVLGKTDAAEFSTRLLEEHFVSRTAMKAPPKKSALNGDLNATQTAEVANELLNEMQRNRGGDTVEEDESRYQVTVHLPGSSGTPDWTGEVIGPPQLLVLKTVNVITAGKNVVVLDKSNKKLWQAALTYAVPSAFQLGISGGESQFGEGPCVERGDTLYVFDQAVLTAFDLNSGNAHWRLPAVGTVGLFFDDQNNIYVNTTSGNPDDIKYSRQIDVNRQTQDVLVKIDPKTGKILWNIKPGGFISYLDGKFIYTIQSSDPNPTDEEVNNDMVAALQKPPYLRIARIRPSDGKLLWEYTEARCPVDVQFDKNSIELVYKREVQVLRYLTF